jgi:hypothetical protein
MVEDVHSKLIYNIKYLNGQTSVDNIKKFIQHTYSLKLNLNIDLERTDSIFLIC